MKIIDGRECNAARGVNITTEFNKFKDVLFNKKKIIRHKMRRIQSKRHKLGTYEIAKISLSCFDYKRYVLDDGVCTLSYFDSDKKGSDKEDWIKKILIKKILIKKIVIIEKDCDY